MIEDLEKRFPRGAGTPVLFAYIRYTDRYTKGQIFACLLRQLLNDYPSVLPVIEETYETCQRDKRRLTAGEMAQLLTQCLKTFEAAYMVFDALDEFPESERDDLVRMLSTLPAKIAFTSRPLDRLHRILPNASVIHIESGNGQDIELFVRSKIAGSSKLLGLMKSTEGLEAETISKVQTKVQGM